MSYKQKRLVLILIVLLGMPMMCAANCDDDPTDVPGINNTGDAMVEAVDDSADTLNELWCLGSVNDWEIRCGGDGVKPQ